MAELISIDLGFGEKASEDTELIDYYVNFIKSLVIKLDHETVNFFFNDRVKIFPLYTRALEFHNYKDQTVKTVVRTIVLSIHKINSKEMQDMLQHVPYCNYYAHLACHLRDLWIEMD